MDDCVAQLGIVRRWLPLIFLGALLTSVPVYLYAASQPRTFKSTASLVIDVGSAPTTDDYAVAEHLATDYARLAGTREFTILVIERLGLTESPDDLRRRVAISAPLGTTQITIEARDPVAAGAAAVANGVVDTLVDDVAARVATRDLEPVDGYLKAIRVELDATQATADGLLALPTLTPEQQGALTQALARIDSLRATYVNLLRYSQQSRSGQLTVLDRAVPPLTSSEPRAWMLALLAGAVGAVVAAVVAFVLEFLDDTLSDIDEIEEATGLPVLGVVTEHRRDATDGGRRRLATLSDPSSDAAEHYRNLRASIDFAGAQKDRTSLLVASPDPSGVSPVVAANLAVAYALAGRRVILADADIRHPAIHKVFLMPDGDGLASLIGGEHHASLADVTRATPVERLLVITAGSPSANPADLLASRAMEGFITDAAARCDVLIVSGPALLGPSDGMTLAPLLHLTVLVVPAGTGGRRVRDALDRMATAGAKVIGVCLHRRVRRTKRVAVLQGDGGR